ncbi:nuclear transport factor 2 family protein [Naasia sp. SYSU D00948]|uniref:nuclear transport factor 2 family protein n=1 Tax=Naasia sp. SYSU D00948 TaxID=2817379 RepID=UPI001B30FACB|nr:nuclear transport factor 2 family protein [Naasia sp. SYSU D00948]
MTGAAPAAERALQRYLAAINSHDFAEVRRVLHPGAVFWFSDATCTTEAEVQAYFENAWRIVEDEVYAAEEIAWLAAGPGLAACTYAYTYAGRHAGVPVSGRGRATNVFAMQEGRWSLVHEHLSPEPSAE